MPREVYVTNIAYETTEEGLRKLFSLSGTVVSVRLITDQRTGAFRGSAYVRMATDAEAADAVASLDGVPLDGRPLAVVLSTPKSQRRPAPAPLPPRRDTKKPPRRR